MITVVETKQEKRLRILLIIFFVSLTAGAFFYRYREPVVEMREATPLAAVINKSTSRYDNPIVVLYQQKDDKHILAQYEVERNNQFQFKTLTAVELKKAPTELYKDTERGVWVKISDTWHYFNEAFELEQRKEPEQFHPTSIPFKEEDAEKSRQLMVLDEIVHLESDERVMEAHPLSRDEHIFLLITNKGVKIAKTDTN